MATFGNSTSNQASESHAERIMVSSAVAPSSGTVQSAVARLWLSSDGDIEDDHTDALFVIYADNNGEPGQLLAVSDVIEVDTFTEQSEHTFTFSGSNQIQIQEGETYWIGPGWRDINGVFFGRTSGGERWEYNFDWDQPPSDLTEEAPRDINAGPMYAVVTYDEDGGSGGTQTKKLYLTSVPATAYTGLRANIWDTFHSDALREPFALSESPAGEYWWRGKEESESTSPWRALMMQFVSDPLTDDGVLTGDVSITVGCMVDDSDAEMRPQWVVWVLTPDGGYRGGYNWYGGSSTEISTTAQGVSFSSEFGDDIPFQAGDRLVVEVGYRALNTTSQTQYGRFYAGGTGPDLSDGDTDVEDHPGFVQITMTAGVDFDHSVPPIRLDKFYLANEVSPVQPDYEPNADDYSHMGDLLSLTNSPSGSNTFDILTETEPGEAWLTQKVWISGPASKAGTLGGLFEITSAWFENDSDADLEPFIILEVLEGDTGNSRGVAFDGNISYELPVDGSGNASTLYGFTYPVQFQAGDRVVVHLGVHTLNDDDDPFSSKLYYGGSGDDLETGDTDFSKPGWVHLPVSEDVTFQDPVDTSTPPGTEFDLSRWHLTTPADGGDGEAEQIDQPELNSYASEFFYLDDQNRMVCHAPVDGYTTSGESGATRTELREHEADYENSAWDPRTTALRSLTLTTQADATNISGGTEPRQEMIIWQVHGDGGTPPLYLAAEYHVSTPRIRLYASDPFFGSDGDYRDNPVVGITPDSFITIKCEVEQGEVRLWVIQGQVEDLPSSPTYTFPVSGFSDVPNWYFKAGAYNKTAIESGSTGYSEARISYLELIQPDQEPIVYTNRFFLAG